MMAIPELTPEQQAKIAVKVRAELDSPGGIIEYDGQAELALIGSEINAVRSQRYAEKLTAAKLEVEATLSALATDRSGREGEMAADAIANLIRVIVEEKP